MPHELIYRTSRLKAFIIATGSAAVAGVGALIIADRTLLGWATVVLFGLCSLAGFAMLFGRGTLLRLDEEGFEIVGMLKRKRVRWADIEPLRIGTIRNARMIAVKYLTKQQQSAVSRSLTGMDVAEGNIYAVSLDELCETMNEWRQRHGGARLKPA